MGNLVRKVWAAETGQPLAGPLPENLGYFELGDDTYSIGLALQQIAPCLRTGGPLPARFGVPIVRTQTPATEPDKPRPGTERRAGAQPADTRKFCAACRRSPGNQLLLAWPD